MFFVCLLVGPSNISITTSIKALFGIGTNGNIRIMQQIRLPRVFAGIIAGGGLAISGLIMQTVLNNPMASPSTLGVSNAATFGANLSIIAFAGGFLDTGSNLNNYFIGMNPYATSLMALTFSILSVLLILGLSRIRNFSPNVVVLSGIAIGAIWTAGTTIMQVYSTDVGLSSAVIWSFGDLSRATYKTDLIMFIVIFVCLIIFWILSYRYNALLSGSSVASSLGINVKPLRFISLLLSSIITSVLVSFLGIIGFVGIICPHVIKRLTGENHKSSIPLTFIFGSLLLLFSDTLSRTIGAGFSLPVGAITSLLGAPFFIIILLRGKNHD